MTHYSETAAGRTPPQKSARWSGILLGLGAGVLLTLAGTRLLGGREAAPPEPAETAAVATQTVTVDSATPAAVADKLAVDGTVQAIDLLSIAPQASGLQIRQILVREGNAVSAGQAIATLDDATLQADLRQAQAQLTVSQAQVSQQQASLAQAQASLAEAQSNLDRIQSLADRGAVSQQELTRQRTETVNAGESVALARAEVESAQAGVRSQQAAIERLQTQLSQTTVRAPVAGVVAERLATVGDVSSPGTPIVTLIQNNQLELAGEVPQAQLNQVAIGAPVAITSNTDSRIQLQGTVASIDPVVDAATRVATVNISLPTSELLKPGMFLRGAITTSSRQGLTIPAAALQPQPDGDTQVFVLGEGNQVTARTVEVGNRITAGGDAVARVEILQGLQAGEQVVTSGVGFLQDGDVVTVVE
ncbi:efflux RND transporter periplasmic adaptor subunit [Nodosilinea sp. LEGE 06152]|uniref:efflux RND transporter periplasmic adaptor subunit n=1 Tax=Nodosilinea sp. LEGE 06152 TaxID=2777966 RepID=UPI001882269F|nr:efflux RND transporter periplasmic adaptor subunit [Nodosilinea sp. LEGE 06152]MBE9157466.1 efflux RND transporter periplasmic adaptor subunit [Nodosilinea sp. LEGE 06152]